MSLSTTLQEYIAAAFTGLWVQSHEHTDALQELAKLCQEQQWVFACWDIEQGLQMGGGGNQTSPGSNDPLAAVRAISALAKPESTGVMVLVNFHRFMNSPEIVQALAQQIERGKTQRTFVVILSPVVSIPTELEKQFVVVEHALPDRGQLEVIARGVATEAGEMPDGVALTQLLDSAAGLTRYEAEGAFSLSLVRHGKLIPESIWDLKTQSLKKSGLLSLHRGTENFSDLGGMTALKSFCTKALGTQQRPLKVQPRGILLLGVPGSGKSAFCKALGHETRRPTLILDVGALLGSLVGQTESNIRQALRIADAMAPCILMLDEVEKALAGANSGANDSGVSARLFGTFLTWLSDHDSDVFVVCTSNDISKLPPEFSRAERFDGVFFNDLPSSAEKARIWEIYLQAYQLPKQDLPRTEDWTGAEIKSCCRLAALLDVSLVDAAKQVVPVAVTAAESVERLRNWASGRCLSVSTPGLYQRLGGNLPTTGRKVVRTTTNN